MVSLKFLAKINKQLTQAKRKSPNNTAILGRLLLVIFMGDFYQFLFMDAKTL